ncbi:MAG: hypothetical protein AAFQ24_14165 [Pseudomonadota bacterium]
MIAVTTLVLFSVAAGIFIILAAAEWRVLPLVWGGYAAESDMRRVQTMLSLVVKAIPPSMMVILFGSAVLIATQVVQGTLGSWTWPVSVTYALFMGGILTKLFQTIRAVKGVDLETASLSELSAVTRDVVLVHYLGLFLSISMMPMFMGVVVQ